MSTIPNDLEQDYTSDVALRTELDAMLPTLTLLQLRFLVARMEMVSDVAACKAIKLSSSTMRKWPMAEKWRIRRALDLMAQDGVSLALHMRKRAVAKAMAVKTALLDSNDERVRSAAATDIIEGELGRPRQTADVRVSGRLDVYGGALAEIREALRDDEVVEAATEGKAADLG